MFLAIFSEPWSHDDYIRFVVSGSCIKCHETTEARSSRCLSGRDESLTVTGSDEN